MKRVVHCQSGLMVLQKYEAYNEACSDLEVRNLLDEFQELTVLVGVRVLVGPRTPANSRLSELGFVEIEHVN
jgi:hypothetical protein